MRRAAEGIGAAKAAPRRDLRRCGGCRKKLLAAVQKTSTPVNVAQPPPAGKSALPAQPLVSVIVASREEGDEIRQTVDSALDAATGPLEVLVVDDASKDGSCDGLSTLGRPGAEVRVLRSETPLGAGRARNAGFGVARGRVLVSVDAHMRFPEGIWHVLGAFALEKQAIVCPRLGSMHGGTQGCGADLCFHRDGKIGMDYHRPEATRRSW